MAHDSTVLNYIVAAMCAVQKTYLDI